MSLLTIIRIGLLTLAFAWLTFCSNKAAAQRLDEWNRLRTQVEELDKKERIFEVSVETRLVRVETSLETISWAIRGIGAAVGLHLLQALAGLILTGRRPPPNPGP